MAINKNHECEEMEGVKCGIVERGVTPERAAFLQGLLTQNGYEVKIVPAPVKAAAKPIAASESVDAPASDTPPAAAVFTVGVTDYTFNSINAIFGRILRTPDGQVVTLAYWRQEKLNNDDSIPYYVV